MLLEDFHIGFEETEFETEEKEVFTFKGYLISEKRHLNFNLHVHQS